MQPHALIVPAALAIFAATLFISLQFTGESVGGPTLNARATAGKYLFDELAGDLGCAACHGMDARGDGTAPDIRKADEAQIIDALHHTGDMRNMGLTDRDIRNVAAYLAYVRRKAGI